MLLTKEVTVKWNSKIKKHYVDLGYVFTKMGDEFIARVIDLTKGSNIEVYLKCDNCGLIFKKPWYRYLIENKNGTSFDCCNNCKKYKIQETVMSKYGVKSIFSLPEIKERIARTNEDKFGSANPFGSSEIQKKIENTNLSKYGCKKPLQNKEILHKVRDTCKERYGVDYYCMTQRFCGDKNVNWKGGIASIRNERASYDYINWRKSVFARDHYTCQCCGAKNGKGRTIVFNAHHIENWKDNRDKRYDVENGITLCLECHYAFHSQYGKKNNTLSQLNAFISNYGKKIC